MSDAFRVRRATPADAGVLAWGRREGLASLVLHASPEGRALYESLGFEPTNEMRFTGDLGEQEWSGV